MKFRLSLFLLSLLLWPISHANASTSGLILSDDSVEIDYRTQVLPIQQQEAIRHYSLMYSQEPAPRNFLLVADLELTQRGTMVSQTYPLRPKIGILAFNNEEETITGVPLGAILRFPVNEKRNYDGLVEAFLSPLFADPITNDWPANYQLPWIMGIRMQLNYPLPEQAEFNLGYRNIRMKINRDRIKTFEQGVFFGITTHF